MTPMRINKSSLFFYLALAVVFISVLSVYIYTLAPGFTTKGDAAEFAVASLINGVPHPPSFPFFILISKLFLLLPFGSDAYRINLVSAFFGALSAVLMFLVLKRTTKNAIVSIIAAFILAFNFLFWKYSIVSEVFVLNCFWALTLIYLSIRVNQNKYLFYYFTI